MNIIHTQDWFFTDSMEPRGYIESTELRELWFHTGTACNLACPFCLEGSKPGDNRLERMTLDDVKPYVDEAITLGVNQFSFTGGEPFVVRDFVNILSYAAKHRPCLVLTNGTKPVLNRAEAIKTLTECEHPISFRISIDYPDEQRHDAGRGKDSYAQAWQGIKLLSDLGFKVSLARQMEKNEVFAEVDAAYRDLLKKYDLPEDLTIVAFPDFHAPNESVSVPVITESCMTTYQTADQRADYMCAFSKMLVKQDGEMRIYACTLVDDDPRYGVTGTLKDSLNQKVMLNHHRCFSCFSQGASCSEI